MFKEYAPGDLFYHKMTPKRFFSEGIDGEKARITAKLQYRYAGPFAVTEVLNPVTYRANINGRIKTVHANKMKRDQAQPIEERDHLIPSYYEDELEEREQAEGAEGAGEARERDVEVGEAGVRDAEEKEAMQDERAEEAVDEVDGAEWYQQWFGNHIAKRDSLTLDEVKASIEDAPIIPLREQPKKTARIPIRTPHSSHRHLTSLELRASLDFLLHKYHN